MAQGFRLPEILEIARLEGRVTVDDLAARLGVTAQTIRRDLAELDEAGKLERVHGGAVLRSGTTNIRYQERSALNAQAKTAIARACAAQIPEGASVFLAIGTTTEALAHELKRHAGLMVVTRTTRTPPRACTSCSSASASAGWRRCFARGTARPVRSSR